MENTQIVEAIQTKFDEIKNISASKTELEAVKNSMPNVTELKSELEAVKSFAEKQALELEKIKDNSTKTKTVSFTEKIKAAVEKVKTLNGHGFTEVGKIDKAAGTMALSTNVVSGTIPQAERDASFNNVPRQAFTVRNRANVGNTSANLVEWVEQVNVDGGAGMTAEGTAKTQQDFDLQVASAAVKKITSFVKVTTEMLDDVENMQAEINGNLLYKIALLEETQLLTGTGLTVNINGISKYAQALDLASLAGTIAAPNYWDVIGAAITQIRVNGKGQFAANTIFMNPADVFLMVHASRATDDNYIYPVTVNPQGTFIWGVPVVQSDSITAGSFLVADMTKFHIRDRQPVTISIGRENDDFTKNLVTILAEERLVSYVKANDVEAFVTDTFADGVTFLTAA